MTYLIKIIIAVSIIVLASELSKRSTTLASILLAMPIVLFASFTIIGRVGKGIQLATVSLKGLAKSISNTHIVSKGLVRTFQFLKGFLGKTGLFAIGTGVVTKFGISTSVSLRLSNSLLRNPA